MNVRRRPGPIERHTAPSRRRIVRLLAGACTIVIAVAACGDGDDSEVDGDPPVDGAVDATPSTPPTPEVSAAPTAPAASTTTAPASTTTLPALLVDWDAVEPADPSVFDYEQVRPVEYEVVSTREFRGVEMQRITFDSPVGGTASGYLSLPVADPVDVGILWGHGAPADGTDSFVPMSVFACAGATSIVVDAPYARPTLRSAEAFLFTPQDRDEQIQLVVDMRRALDLLTDLGAARLGFGGISYGASIGGLLLGVDERPEAGVLLLGNGGIVERFTAESGGPVFPLATRSDEEIRGWIEAMLPIEPIHFVGDSRADLLFMSGVADTMIPPAEAERFHDAAPADAELYWMDEGHDIPFEDMYLHNGWLGDRLGLDRNRLDACLTELFPNGWNDL
jgi:hypothetical protein